MKQFDKLCDTFNIDGVSESVINAAIAPPAPVVVSDEDEDETAESPETPEPQPQLTYKGQKYTLDSFRYMKSLLQQKIQTDSDVLATMQQMCKVGANARLFEVYATLSNTVAAQIKQLQDMEKVMTDYQVTEEREKMQRENMAQKERLLQIKAEAGAGGNTYNIQNNTNLCLTSTELEAMLEKADTDRQINTAQISTDFDLE